MEQTTIDSRTKNVKRNIIWGMVYRLLTLLLPFLTTTAMIYYMGSIYLGLNSLFAAVLQVLSLTELGVGSAMVFSMYRPMAEDDTETVCALLALYRKIYFIIGMIILVLGLIFLPFLDLVISGETPPDVNVYIVYLIQLFNTALNYCFFSYKSSLMTAGQRLDVYNNIGSVTEIALDIGKLAAIIVFHNYYVYSILIPVFTILRNLLVHYMAGRMYPQYQCRGHVNREELADIRRRVTGLFLDRLATVLYNSLDSIVISATLGLVILAKYNNYYYILNALTILTGVLTTSMVASVGNSIISEDTEKNYEDFRLFQYLFMWGISWCTVCLYVLYQPFVELWVGSSLLFSSDIMIIFCIYFFAKEMLQICYVYRQAAGLWWQDRFRPAVESILNLILNIVLVRYLGVAGVLIASIICYAFINTPWGSWVLFRYYFTGKRLSSYLLKLLYFALVTIGAAAVTGFIAGLIPLSGIVGLIAKGALCVVLPNLIFGIFYGLLPERKSAVGFLRSTWKA